MKPIEVWFRKQRQRQAKRQTLESALFTNRLFRYAGYRLRFFSLNLLLELSLKIVEITILAHIFHGLYFLTVLGARIIFQLMIAWWWGVLEDLREQGRQLQRDKRSYRLSSLVQQWLKQSVAFSFLLTVAGVILFTLYAVFYPFTPSTAFALVCLFRLILTIPVRCLYSGIYSIKRIYRPIVLNWCLEIFSLVSGLIFVLSFGAWGIAVGAWLGAVLSTILQLHYILQAYKTSHITIPRVSLEYKGLPHLFQYRHVAPGFAFVCIELDSIILMALLVAHHYDKNLSIAIYSISPLLRAAGAWPRLFYFDLKRLELDLFSNLRHRFSFFIRVISLGLGSIFAGLAWVIIQLWPGSLSGFASWLLVPILCGRSLFSFIQLEYFSARKYKLTIYLGLIYAVIILLCISMPISNSGPVSVILVICLLPLLRQKHQGIAVKHGRLIPLPLWINTIRAIQTPCRIRGIYFDLKRQNSFAENFLWHLTTMYKTSPRATLLPSGQLLWLENREHMAHDAKLIEYGEGLIRQIDVSQVCQSGAELMAQLFHETGFNWLRKQLSLIPAQPFLVASITEEFHVKFPNGQSIDFDKASARITRVMTAQAAGTLMKSAIEFARNFRHAETKSPYDVSCLVIDGSMVSIFVVPHSYPQHERASWNAQIVTANLQAAVYGVVA